jgi:AAA domain
MGDPSYPRRPAESLRSLKSAASTTTTNAGLHSTDVGRFAPHPLTQACAAVLVIELLRLPWPASSRWTIASRPSSSDLDLEERQLRRWITFWRRTGLFSTAAARPSRDSLGPSPKDSRLRLITAGWCLPGDSLVFPSIPPILRPPADGAYLDVPRSLLPIKSCKGGQLPVPLVDSDLAPTSVGSRRLNVLPFASPVAAPVRPAYRFYSIDDLQGLPDPLWLVADFVPERSIAMLFGPPGVGKSFVALDLALSVATGRPWHGRATRRGPVVYVFAEGQAGAKKRINGWLKTHELKPLGLSPSLLRGFLRVPHSARAQ